MAEICTINAGRVEAATSSQSNESTIEIDDCADMTVLRSNFLPIHNVEIYVDVSGWDASSGSVECPTISGDISYHYPISGQFYMLV